jgi:hypothetical protein
MYQRTQAFFLAESKLRVESSIDDDSQPQQ